MLLLAAYKLLADGNGCIQGGSGCVTGCACLAMQVLCGVTSTF